MSIFMKENRIQITIIIMIAIVTAAIFAGCGGSEGNGEESTVGGGPVVMSSVYEDLYSTIKFKFIEEGSFTEADFEGENIPTYLVMHLKKGDEGFDDYLAGLGFDPEAVEEVIHFQPMMIVHSDNVLVIHASNVDTVKRDLEAYHSNQEQTWSQYLPDQYEKVKNNTMNVKGNYIYYVTHEYQDDLVNAIEKHIK